MNVQVIGNDICVDLVRKAKSVTQVDICAVLAVWRHLGQIFRETDLRGIFSGRVFLKLEVRS